MNRFGDDRSRHGGLIYLLRWFWWRINAWAEIAAVAGSFIFALGSHVAPARGLGW